MGIPNRQIGWSQESNLLWGIWNDLSKVSRAVNCCNGSSTNPTNVVLPAVASDAFGRQRVSEPYTLFDSSHRYADNNLWSTSTSTGGTAVFNADQGLVDLSVTGSANSEVIRETVKVFSYQPGKSLLVLNTFVMAPAVEGLRQRVGYYGDDNGLFIQLEDSTLSFVKRTLVSGTVDDIVVNQSDWNYDKLDGSGPSGITLDITKAQIFWMDIEWLGVGSVRMGFVINGQFIIAHIFNHANIIASTYITTASLPLRYEIKNTAATETVSTLKQICSSVISEGGYELRGTQYSIGTTIGSPRTFALASTYYPIIGIQLKSTRLDAVVILANLSLVGLGNSKYYSWRLVQGATLTGGSWNTIGTDSSVNYNLTATAVVDGRVIDSGFISSSNQGSQVLNLSKDALFSTQLERNGLTGTAVDLVLEVAVASTSGGEGVYAAMDWQEISR